ncbi:restriction endonuclease [Streptomyces canus]|uniref:hypothetical protein n=1 Tax=Streptomyces canus TaxID=58343 RepID=UPI002E2ACB3B|nr:hypothetical protein [Streptomyces canus]
MLITTSWFGRTSHDFARQHGRLQLIEGPELKYLIKEHLGKGCDPGPGPPEEAPLALRPVARPLRPRSWAVRRRSTVAKDDQRRPPGAPDPRI